MWRELLKEAVARSSRAAVARELGVSRPSVSMLLAGKYPGNTERMEKRILSAFGRKCPVYGGNVTREQCAMRKMAIMPTSNPLALSKWRECQHCEGV